MQGEILSTVCACVCVCVGGGSILSTKRDTQYCGRYHDAHGGISLVPGGVQYHGGKIFSYLSTPRVSAYLPPAT